MATVDLGGTEQPIDPMLVKAIETAFLAFSVPTVTFVPVPRAWKRSNRSGSHKGPSSLTKASIKIGLIERDGFQCAYCARQFVDLTEATLDHVIPNCVVGHWKPWNLVLACEPCNNAKADGIPAILLPVLCSLLAASPRLIRVCREQRERANAEAKQREQAAQCEQAKLKAERKRRHQFYVAMRDLGAPFVRLAIEPPPARPELLPGEGGRP